MKLKNWLFISGAFVILASCGENSTSETTPDSTASAVNTGTPTVDPPATAKDNFSTRYPGATNVTWGYYSEPYSNVDWEWTAWPALDEKDYVVRYNWDGSDHYTWYDQDGNWIGTVATVNDHSSLPAAVNNTVKKEFAGYTITAVDKENDKDREAYEVELEKGDQKAKALIASDGTVLKKKGSGMEKEKVDVK